MASSTGSTQQQHSNPKVAKVLAFAARKDAQGVTYPSAAALCRAASEHHGDATLATKVVGRAVRQVARDNGDGVGRGRTYGQGYNGKVAQGFTRAAKAVAKAQQGSKAKAQPKASKASK